MKLREIVYMVLDELKLFSDDTDLTEEHVIFLVNKYRTFILKQRYSDIRKEIPSSNYQEICLDLTENEDNNPCDSNVGLRSIQTIPDLMSIGNNTVYPMNYYQGLKIAFISRERMKYVGKNKYLKNIIYCSLGPDNRLYLTSNNPQYVHLQKLRFNGVFEDAEEAAKLSCNDNNGDTPCDPMDKEFPLEAALINPVIELTVKELTAAQYKIKDDVNNATDDLGDIANYVRLNTKSQAQKDMGL